MSNLDIVKRSGYHPPDLNHMSGLLSRSHISLRFVSRLLSILFPGFATVLDLAYLFVYPLILLGTIFPRYCRFRCKFRFGSTSLILFPPLFWLYYGFPLQVPFAPTCFI